MAATGHAILGPSSSHRWLNCAPSARIEEGVQEKPSEFAEEGSCAHALCEELLWNLLGNEEKAAEARKEQEKNNRDKWYNNEMQACAEEYAAVVWGKYTEALKTTKDAKLFIERRLTFERWIPESFGTADATIIADGMMEVIDFKYGKGVEVSAIDNSQMMIYGLGAIAEFEDEYDIQQVRMTIVQPRMNNISEYEMTEEKLVEWANDTLKPKAEKAFAGEGDQTPGEWCRFCKIKATCTALAKQALTIYTTHESKETISDDMMPDILKVLPAIKSWCNAVEDYATAKAINGTKFKGFKIVEGRSIRKITDQTSLGQALLTAGYDTLDIYKQPELRTITELEKLVGKKIFSELSKGCIEKPEGKPTLVPESDKRQEININTAVDDFKNIKTD